MARTIKALFFDIDGTLVSFETHRIPQSTVDALTEAKTRGVKIYISTGRPIMIINNLGQIEHLIDGYITTNGARCFVGDTVVSEQPILPADVAKVVAHAEKYDYPVVVVGETRLIIHHPTEVVNDIFVEGLGVKCLDYSLSLDDLKGEHILQLTPFCTEEQERELMPTLENCTSGRWHPAFTDITAKGADKGSGLHAMAQHLGLDIAETMAFGDGGNDLTILQEAGIGVAMGNAGEDVKGVADYVTTSVDDNGVSNALQHFGVIS